MPLSDDSVVPDQARLQELYASGLLGTASPASFDRYTRLTARTLGVPIALITLVDAERLYIVSDYGLPRPWNAPCEMPLHATYCQRVVTSGQPVVIGDMHTQSSEIHQENLQQLGIVAYASVPLQTENGQTLGTLCALDYVAHEWSALDREHLEDLASAVVAQIVLSKTAHERWQTLDALRASQANLTAIFEQADDAIYSIDLSKRLVMFNPTFAKYRRLSEMEPTPEFHPNGLFTADDLEFWSQQYDRALAGEQFHFEYQRMIAGSERWYDVSLNPIRVDGVITGVLVMSRNLTDRIRQEQQRLDFERSWQETQHLESLAVLAGGIAHDFNNLLATIQGNAGLALLDLPPHSPIRESLLHIDHAVEQSARLTRQLLAYAGKGRLSTQPIDMCVLIADMRRLISAALPQSVLVSYHLEPELPLIDGDSAHLQQVVMNLIVNAAEAIEDEHGTVIISTSLLEVGTQPAAGADFEPTLPAGSYMLLEVRDSGSGMDAATQARMFEPFFTTKFTGRGLGLAAVQGIVRGHHGGLHVQSVLGQGTIFQVAFPCTRAVSVPTSVVSSKLPIAVAPAAGAILVIDDEPGVLQVATRLLERLGYVALACADRQEALDLFRNASEQVQAIVLDWTMPGLSGVEMIRGLRAIRADVPIVVMSGYSAHEISLPLEIPDLNGFIQKPFRIHDLREAMAQISALLTNQPDRS